MQLIVLYCKAPLQHRTLMFFTIRTVQLAFYADGKSSTHYFSVIRQVHSLH